MTLFFLSLAALLNAPGPIALDATHQLFMDDYLIESTEGLNRRIIPATKSTANPVLQGDRAWEQERPLLYGSVLKEDGKYRMWYYMPRGVCYAESADGITWTKPLMAQYLWEGKPSNIVVHLDGTPDGEVPFPYFYELFGVFRDDNEPDPDRRYKMGYLSIERRYEGPDFDVFHPSQRRGLGVATSPDGIHWTNIDSFATYAIVDGSSHWAFDPATKQYHLYGRSKRKPAALEAAWGDDPWYKKHFWGRVVAHTTSGDFLNWAHKRPDSAPVVMGADLEDAVATEVYGMGAFKYGDVFVGLVQRFENRPENVFLDIQLAVSRDGNSFTRVGDRTPFIANGAVGDWDRFNTAVANNPPIAEGDELRFYYSDRRYRHGPYEGNDSGPSTGAIGFATAKQDRFVALEANYEGGVLVTKPLVMTESTLYLNARADWGEIQVEALDADGNAIATAEAIHKDGLEIPVRWNGPEPPRGTSVRLRISLRNGQLYAIWSR
jgi:hypothetical protein